MEGDRMKPGDTVYFDGQPYTVLEIVDRNEYEKLPGVKLLGDGVIVQNTSGQKQYFLDFDFDC
jgi:hypothetical protein